jgi:hypothetical protein
MAEVVLLLPNTDHLQQAEDYELVEGGQYLVEVEQPLP